MFLPIHLSCLILFKKIHYIPIQLSTLLNCFNLKSFALFGPFYQHLKILNYRSDTGSSSCPAIYKHLDNHLCKKWTIVTFPTYIGHGSHVTNIMKNKQWCLLYPMRTLLQLSFTHFLFLFPYFSLFSHWFLNKFPPIWSSSTSSRTALILFIDIDTLTLLHTTYFAIQLQIT